MMQEKTNRDVLFEKLPDHAALFLERRRSVVFDNLDEPYKQGNCFFTGAFTWDLTPEGHSYWHSLLIPAFGWEYNK